MSKILSNHYAKFKENGERETSIALNVHFMTEEELQPYLEQGYVPISDEEQAQYATGQYIRGADGKPIKKPACVPTTEEKMDAIRAERDRLLDSTTWIFQRQQTGSESQKLPDEEYQKWVDYWAALRDFPATCDVDNPVWPMQPAIE